MLKFAFLLVAIVLGAQALKEGDLVGDSWDVQKNAEAENQDDNEDADDVNFEEFRKNRLAEVYSREAIRERAYSQARQTSADYSVVKCSGFPDAVAVAAGETITFTSPKHKKKYPNNKWCGWVLYGGPVTRFNITCQTFNVQKANEKTGECMDYLSLEDEQFCGENNSDGPTGWLSYDWWDDVIFSFTSDKKHRYKGFTCTATAYIRDSLVTTEYPSTTPEVA